MFLKAGVACCLVMAALSASERSRVDRAVALSNERLTEWLGAASAPAIESMRWSVPIWSQPMSMGVESQAAFQLARARFAGIAESPDTRAFLDGVAGHLQARIVEELFDQEHHRPGHHAIDVPAFGGHVAWSVPSLVVSRSARDERIAPAIAHAADAVATLEGVVGWPSLAAALRVLASEPSPLDRRQVTAILEASLGVPVAWFMAALDPGFAVNHALMAVASRPATCAGDPCVRTTIDLAHEGAVLFPAGQRPSTFGVALRLDFGGGSSSTLWWSGRASERIEVESGQPPVSVRLDPARAIRVDPNLHDQRWQQVEGPAARPVKSLAAWAVWLQHAVLTYAALL